MMETTEELAIEFKLYTWIVYIRNTQWSYIIGEWN